MERRLDPLGHLTQYVLVARIASAALTMVVLVSGPRLTAPLTAVLMASLVASFVLMIGFNYLALRYWNAVVFDLQVSSKPYYLLLDVLLSMTVLAIVGAGAPLVLYPVGTVLLAGLVYSRMLTATTEVILLAGYELVQVGHLGYLPGGSDLHTLVTVPALLLGGGFAGLAIKRLIERRERAQREIGVLRELDAVRQERLRVARDMHDSVTKNLHGVWLLARGIDAALSRGDLDAARSSASVVAATAQELVAQTRTVIQGLRDPGVEGSLSRALSESVRRTAAGHDLTVEVSVDEPPEVDQQVRDEVLAVAVEAVHNTVKHAAAQRIEVRLTADRDALTLSLMDDGCGFRVGDGVAGIKAGHFGLAGMRERAERMGGRLGVISRPGDGTRIELIVPLAVVRARAIEETV